MARCRACFRYSSRLKDTQTVNICFEYDDESETVGSLYAKAADEFHALVSDRAGYQKQFAPFETYGVSMVSNTCIGER